MESIHNRIARWRREAGHTKGEIVFASKFIDMIDDGVKTTTVRSGVRNYEPGTYDLYNPAKSVHGYVKIKGTSVIMFGQLTDEIAKTDGFSSVNELKNELLRFYPYLKLSDPVTVVYLEKYNNEEP